MISDHTMLGWWVQFPSQENDNSASFDTSIEVLGPFIEGHKVAGHYLCPASIYLEQVLSGASFQILQFRIFMKMAVNGQYQYSQKFLVSE
ncbi:hypothetical protein BDR07DRAFT_997191 [Suillus spraguei]|nr:hypothetical protein BDR07DRAFT_997191 [Suillus spraguei]